MEVFKDDIEEACLKIAKDAKRYDVKPGTAEYYDVVQEGLKEYLNWSKAGAVLATLLARRDVTVSYETATVALENNAVPLVAALVAALETGGVLTALEGTAGVLGGLLTGKAIQEVYEGQQEKTQYAQTMDAHDGNYVWVDEGFTVVDPVSNQLITLVPGMYPILPGFDALPPLLVFRG